MLKAILLDADGIVIQGRQKYFSEILSEKQGVELEVVLDFFKKDYKKCVLGQADLKQEVAKYLDKWKWQGTADELLSFWFSKDGAILIKFNTYDEKAAGPATNLFLDQSLELVSFTR